MKDMKWLNVKCLLFGGRPNLISKIKITHVSKEKRKKQEEKEEYEEEENIRKYERIVFRQIDKQTISKEEKRVYKNQVDERERERERGKRGI